jgi:hypothetical protein
MKCDVSPEVGVSAMALKSLQEELSKVEKLIDIYGVSPDA